MRTFAAGHNHQQPNDPAKLGPAIIKIVHAENPPMRLPLGTDTVAVIEKKNAFVAAELEKWRSLATSTAFDK
jgi:hypothetical protein